MASDPYHTFAAELRKSLDSAHAQAQSYLSLSRRQASTSVSRNGAQDETQREALQSSHDALADALESLRADVDDVRESVRVVARSPERFGVDAKELEGRKAFVRTCEGEIEQLEKLAGARPSARGPSGSKGHTALRMDEAGDDDDDDDEDPNEAFEREQQASLLAKQDTTLSLIGNTITTLRSQAATLGQEIGEQVELVGALDQEVDSSQGRLKRAMGRMDELVRRGDDRLGGWCVWILVVVLFILLLMVILI